VHLDLLESLGYIILHLRVLDLELLYLVIQLDLALLEGVAGANRGLLQALEPRTDIFYKLLLFDLKSAKLALYLLGELISYRKHFSVDSTLEIE